MTHVIDETTKKIQMLNDLLRCDGIGGHFLFSERVSNLNKEERMEVFEKVRTFNSFCEDNDPYKEHDFGSIDCKLGRIFWKIDYYDTEIRFGSDFPEDPKKTIRVMTIMFAEEY